MEVDMTGRMKLDPKRVGTMLKAMSGFRAAIERSTLEHPLLYLVKVRASQLNGCAYCIDMHTKDARAAGETEQRLYALNAWHEAPFYTERERAALAWTDAATRIGDHGVPDHVYDAVRSVFSEDEIMALALAVAEINGWNRIVRPFDSDVGSYQPSRAARAAQH
jgi:AhpD family alkylhydroperoxidase